MRSLSLHHFPRITFKDQEKFLWNPILKKAFKNLPEERVRLQLVDYLTEEAAFSKNRLSFETPVNLPRDKAASRTDLICYDSDFKPLLLIECKAPEIKLDGKAAIQISRYNQMVGASTLMISNGVQDYWFTAKGNELLQKVPEQFKPISTVDRNYEYWTERGFAGKNSDSEIQPWIKDSCIELYMNDDSAPQFFNFEGTAPDLLLSNFYRIFPVDEQTNLALSLTATPFGATKLNAVLNQNGENLALLSASLDLLATEESQNSILQNHKGFQQLDIVVETGLNFGQPLGSYVSELAELMS